MEAEGTYNSWALISAAVELLPCAAAPFNRLTWSFFLQAPTYSDYLNGAGSCFDAGETSFCFCRFNGCSPSNELAYTHGSNSIGGPLALRGLGQENALAKWLRSARGRESLLRGRTRFPTSLYISPVNIFTAASQLLCSREARR